MALENQEKQSPSNEDKVSREDFNEVVGLVRQLADQNGHITQKFNTFQQSVLEKLNQSVQTIEQKVKPTEKEEDSAWWEGFDEDSKKAVKSEFNHQVSTLESKLDKKIQESTKSLETKLQQDRKKAEVQSRYDAKALQEFPQINDPKHPLSKEFSKLWAEKKSEDESWEYSPSAIYDTARIAYANLVNRGEIIPDNFRDEVVRTISVHDGFMPSPKTKTPSKPEELTKEQMFMVNKFGISPERYLKQLKDPFGVSH